MTTKLVVAPERKKGISIFCVIFISLLICASSYSQTKDDKDAEVFWIEKGDLNRIYVARYSAEKWQEKEQVFSSENPLTSLAVGTTLSGTRMVVWSEFLDGKLVLKQAQLSDDSSLWSGGGEILSSQGSNSSSVLVRGMDSVMNLIWASDRDGLDDIYRSQNLGGSWSNAIKVNADNDVPDIAPTASINTEGDIELNWLKYDRSLRGYGSESLTLNIEKRLRQNEQEAMRIFKKELSYSALPLPSVVSANVSAVLHFPSHYYIQSVRNSD